MIVEIHLLRQGLCDLLGSSHQNLLCSRYRITSSHSAKSPCYLGSLADQAILVFREASINTVLPWCHFLKDVPDLSTDISAILRFCVKSPVIREYLCCSILKLQHCSFPLLLRYFAHLLDPNKHLDPAEAISRMKLW